MPDLMVFDKAKTYQKVISANESVISEFYLSSSGCYPFLHKEWNDDPLFIVYNYVMLIFYRWLTIDTTNIDGTGFIFEV